MEKKKFSLEDMNLEFPIFKEGELIGYVRENNPKSLLADNINIREDINSDYGRKFHHLHISTEFVNRQYIPVNLYEYSKQQKKTSINPLLILMKLYS